MNPDDDEQLDPFEDEGVLVFEPEDDFPEDDEGVTEDVEEDFIIPAQVFPAPVTIPTIPAPVTIPTIPAPIQGQEATSLAVDELMEEPVDQDWQDWEEDTPEDGPYFPPTTQATEELLQGISFVNKEVFKTFHELMVEVTTASADHILAYVPHNNDDEWNLNGYNSTIRTAVSRFVLSYLDGLLDAAYRTIIGNITNQRMWKEQETRYGEPASNALPLEVALDLIDDKAQCNHVRDVATEFFGLPVQELTMVTLDMKSIEAMTIISDFPILSPHSLGQRVTEITRIAYDPLLVDKAGILGSDLDHTDRVSDLSEINLQEFNLLVHAFSAAMVFGYIYLLDLGDEYCTFVARSKQEMVLDTELDCFLDAMMVFVEDKSHLIRDVNGFSTQYCASHGIFAKTIETALVDLVLLAVEDLYMGRKAEAHKMETMNLRTQIKQAANQSTNSFGWS